MTFCVISKNYLNILMAEQLLHFVKIPLSASVFFHNLLLYMKDLKLLVLVISALSLIHIYKADAKVSAVSMRIKQKVKHEANGEASHSHLHIRILQNG